MTNQEAVKAGLVTQDEICAIYDPNDWLGFECLADQEYDQQAVDFHHERVTKELAAWEVQEQSYVERAEEYADAWFEGCMPL